MGSQGDAVAFGFFMGAIAMGVFIGWSMMLYRGGYADGMRACPLCDHPVKEAPVDAADQ